MRKLNLQMQISADGFVAGPDGQLDWMTWNWDEKLKDFVNRLHETIDTILLGRKMTDGFVAHWESVTPDRTEEYPFAQVMVNTSKVVFSKTISQHSGKNVVVENGDLVQAVNELKNRPGKDIIVYGGASFVSSLIENGLIDELNLFINPTAIGEGLRIFTGCTALKLTDSTAYDCGIVVNRYQPA
jgi:dihydrofolate reductase